MMGLNPILLGHAIYLFATTIPLGVFVAGVLAFFKIGIKSNCDVILFVVFIPRGDESKVGQPIEIFWCPKS